jgi:hypothetical protein
MKKADKIDALKKLKAGVESERFGRPFYNGLCLVIEDMWDSNKIDDNQAEFLEGIIPEHHVHEYVWKIGAKSPRIKFINEHLKRLEKK